MMLDSYAICFTVVLLVGGVKSLYFLTNEKKNVISACSCEFPSYKHPKVTKRGCIIFTLSLSSLIQVR